MLKTTICNDEFTSKLFETQTCQDFMSWPGSNVDSYSGIVDFARERKVADHAEAAWEVCEVCAEDVEDS